MAVNDSHVLLAANDEVTVHPITLVRSTNSSETSFNTSFSTTVLGEYSVLIWCPFSRLGNYFVWCWETCQKDKQCMIVCKICLVFMNFFISTMQEEPHQHWEYCSKEHHFSLAAWKMLSLMMKFWYQELYHSQWGYISLGRVQIYFYCEYWSFLS